MINHVQLQGRLTADPQSFNTAKGGVVVSMSLAWNSGAPDAKGTFVNCKIFGRMAEHVADHLRKGDLVFIHGRLNTESYTGKDGKERSSLVVIVEVLIPHLVSLPGGSPPPARSAPATSRTPAAAPATETNEDDVPF